MLIANRPVAFTVSDKKTLNLTWFTMNLFVLSAIKNEQKFLLQVQF